MVPSIRPSSDVFAMIRCPKTQSKLSFQGLGEHERWKRRFYYFIFKFKKKPTWIATRPLRSSSFILRFPRMELGKKRLAHLSKFGRWSTRCLHQKEKETIEKIEKIVWKIENKVFKGKPSPRSTPSIEKYSSLLKLSLKLYLSCHWFCHSANESGKGESP